MRYNKQELTALATQTSQNFDREGVLVLKERRDSFFRRTEGCTIRWFRLRGNLLFYLKGLEPWYEPLGVIVLGQHQVKVQDQDEHGHWPFHIVLDSGICYRMATLVESERTLWLKAIEMAPYDNLKSQIAALCERLNSIIPIIDIDRYKQQKGIVTDMNEVPLCELALSCDNLLCDAYGRPPSPVIVVHVKLCKGLCIRYGATEIVETCSNPSFSKTILFRASDGITGDVIVRLLVYDVRERVTVTAVPMGFTSFQLSTIQEAQRMRVALSNHDNRTVGFVTINGWSLEPSYIGTSPCHKSDKNSTDIPQKLLSHRRSQSLPPRLGLKLKFPSYGILLKQIFVNSHQVTYRFHSGLGGDITVHEIMAEPKLCFVIPVRLLDIFIQREKELLEELLSVGEMSGHWQRKKLDLVSIHVSLIKHYCHSKKSMLQYNNTYFKQSCKKEDSSLLFAPVNLHLQRMWVHNDTLNKTGFHDVVTAGAFTANAHKSERCGGLIRLVQQVKDINDSRAAMNAATASKIQAEYDNVLAFRRIRDEIIQDIEKSVVSLQARQEPVVLTLIEAIKRKTKAMLKLWDPQIIEESLSCIGWPKNAICGESEEQTIKRLTEQLSIFEISSDYKTLEASSSSSKENSPTFDLPTLSASVPNMCPNESKTKNLFKHINEGTELQFHHDYFDNEREGKKLNNSLISVCLPIKHKLNETQSLSFESKSKSLHNDFKSSASLEQVSYRSLMENLSSKDKKKFLETRRESDNMPYVVPVDPDVRKNNLALITDIGSTVQESVNNFADFAIKKNTDNVGTVNEELEQLKSLMMAVKSNTEDMLRWLRTSHAAMRLTYEVPQWTRDNAVLQTRRDTCFSQALTTLTTGLLCWLCSVPSDVIVKLLTSGLGPLCGFEGLLSLYAMEKTMWGDMVVAIEDLQTVQFTFNKVGHSNPAMPHATGSRGALTVYIPISDSLYSKLQSKEQLTFTITAVFFNIGINDKATLAEALCETTPQYHSNSDNLERLNKYYHKYCKIFNAENIAATRASSRTKPLEEVMENLRIAIQKKVPKNVEVLHLAALATRLMNGVRFTSCKSAKDRTGMSVTLEQCSILASEYHLADHEIIKALSVMRSEGCRRFNTVKNIGVNKYAFTKKQVAALPAQYQPPQGTYGSTHT